ncbi:MAG: hypothetical protein F6J98_09870 [Moorea sp. SIO4G2]|nr:MULTISPECIES: hypothetical protein [Moorena]NEO16224.1 hypothetical protein [Moorena sp. SIO3E8]NEO60719.1 hypothetical protein [Moorena sp. SIO4G2]NEQ02120.1 hypothetical protein [Moorena sp. SIO3F7]
MTNSDQFDTRFNLLLTAIEQISQQIEQLRQRTDSNARAIEALTDTVHEFKRDRSQLYSVMANLAQSQSNLFQSQANLADSQSRMYGVMENLDQRQEQLSQGHEQLSQRQEQLSNRQGEIVEILKLLTQSN